jgi:CrcB protein
MKEFTLVFAGAGLGGVLRYGVVLGCIAAFGPAFPWGTIIVNSVGSLLMGVLAASLMAFTAPSAGDLRLLLGTGVLGGFTTFSAFSLEAFVLWDRGEAGLALAYVLCSVVLSISALALGFAGFRWLT